MTKSITLEEGRRALFNEFLEFKKGNISIDQALTATKMIHEILLHHTAETDRIRIAMQSPQFASLDHSTQLKLINREVENVIDVEVDNV